MNKDYLIIQINNSTIESIKLNKDLKIISKLKTTNINKFIEYSKNTNIIIYDKKIELISLLKLLYKNKIYNYKFKYIELKDKINKQNSILNIYNELNKYLLNKNINDLDELLYKEINYGRLFRGLNYSKYLCDIKINNNKYYGYIIDLSKDKYVSYYALLKELNEEYFTADEINNLKNKSGIIILNICYIREETLSLTNFYSIQETTITNNISERIINGIKLYLKYKENNKELKLILWGKLNYLKENYKTLNKNILNKFINNINLIKEPWDYFIEGELWK